MQQFLVQVSAPLLPPLTEEEVHDEIAALVYRKERPHGMGGLGVLVTEVPVPEPAWEQP